MITSQPRTLAEEDSKRITRYTLDLRTYNLLKAQHGDEYKCEVCPRIFQPGDKIVSRRSGRSGTVVWYCAKCWQIIGY